MTNTMSLQTHAEDDDWQRGYDAGLSDCTHYSYETFAFATGFLAGRAKREQYEGNHFSTVASGVGNEPA